MSEKGHAKNLENLKKTKEIIIVWGAKYQPTNVLYKLPNITSVITAAETVAAALQAVRAPYRVAASAADDAFEPLSKLMTRFERGFKASGAPASAVEDLTTDTRKVKGRRKSPAPIDDPNTPDINEAEKGHSTSQMSRVNRIEHLDSAIATAEQYSIFDPNEPDLKIAALKALSADLKAKVEAVNAAYALVSNALNERDRIYYKGESSVVVIGQGIKNYVVSAFGFGSPEHKQVRGLEFKEVPR